MAVKLLLFMIMKSLCLAVALALTPLFTSCGSMRNAQSAQVIAAKSLRGAQDSAMAALNVYGELYRKGALSESQILKVRTAYKQYQTGFLAAVDLARGDLNAPIPDLVSRDLSILLTTIAELSL